MQAYCVKAQTSGGLMVRPRTGCRLGSGGYNTPCSAPLNGHPFSLLMHMTHRRAIGGPEAHHEVKCSKHRQLGYGRSLGQETTILASSDEVVCTSSERRI
jgi:hypothetical protein